jgi:signal peptidase I
MMLVSCLLLVDKFSYGIHLPIFNTELFDISDPSRSDVIVFRYPNYDKQKKYEGTNFIKRVIGLPGGNVGIIELDGILKGSAINPLSKNTNNNTG